MSSPPRSAAFIWSSVVGLAGETAKFTLANLVYNFTRLTWLQSRAEAA
jgi:hypothetical protein